MDLLVLNGANIYDVGMLGMLTGMLGMLTSKQTQRVPELASAHYFACGHMSDPPSSFIDVPSSFQELGGCSPTEWSYKCLFITILTL